MGLITEVTTVKRVDALAAGDKIPGEWNTVHNVVHVAEYQDQMFGHAFMLYVQRVRRGLDPEWPVREYILRAGDRIHVLN